MVAGPLSQELTQSLCYPDYQTLALAQCTFEDIYGDDVCKHHQDTFITCVRKNSCRCVKANCTSVLAVF